MSDAPLQVAKRGRPSEYTLEEVQKGLHALALTGSPTKAAEACGVPKSTLIAWRDASHTTEYERIRSEVMPRVHAQMAAQSEDLARVYADLEQKAAAQMETQLHELKANETAGALRNFTVARGVSIDKAALLRGQPTSRVEHSIDDTTARLIRLGIDVVDGTTTQDEPQDALLAD